MIELEKYYYRPKDGYFGDPVPFFWNGEFHVFYLKDTPERRLLKLSYHHVSSKDLVQWKEFPVAIPPGDPGEADYPMIGGGNMMEERGKFHFFYMTRKFKDNIVSDLNILSEAICHATSDDLVNWTKDPNNPVLFPDSDLYHQRDFRDPFVFLNENEKEYWMLVSSRVKEGPSRRRGCIALCASKNLREWEVREPFWSPNLYYTLECPELFKIGDWWYMVYSEFSERVVTHYRMCRTLEGPWTAPTNDAFDGSAFYAGHTASDGKDRFVFAWNPTREESKDYYGYHWGGNLVVHKISQEKDGSLSVGIHSAFDKLFGKKTPVIFTSGLGKWQFHHGSVTLDAPDSFACAAAQMMPNYCRISTKITFGSNTRDCGVILRTSDNFEYSYYVRLEPGRNRLVFDAWPRGKDPDLNNPFRELKGALPYVIELERPIELFHDHPHELNIFVDDSICEVYLDNKVAMSTRLYSLEKGKWGVFVTEGKATFEEFELSIPI